MRYNLYVYEPERSEKDFLRQSLIQLALEKNTPTDVFDADFSSVKTEQAEYFGIRGKVTVDYTVSIGYQRKETYKEYNNGTRRFETKEKTVTDWQASSGSYTSTMLSAYQACGENEDENESRFIANAIQSCPKDHIRFYDDEDDFPAHKGAEDRDIANAKEILHDKGQIQCLSHLPGDLHKDFRANSTLHTQESALHVAPLHTLTYQYEGEEYTSRALAFGKYNEISKKPDASAKNNAELNEKTKRFGFIAIGAALLSCILSLAVPLHALIYIFFIASAIATALFFVMRFLLQKNMQENNKQQRICALTAAFERLGLPPLTQEEQELLNKGGAK